MGRHAFQYSVKFCEAIRPEQEATRGQEGSAIKLRAGRVMQGAGRLRTSAV